MKEPSLLSTPTKMPGKSFGFSPTKCKIGRKLRLIKGSVCNGCYAFRGNYRWPNTVIAHEYRYQMLKDALDNPVSRYRFIGRLVQEIGRQRVPYFRWHDSGDLQSVDHLRLIAEVCSQTPHISHWLPTREYKIVREFMATNVCPDNLTIRLSAHMKNTVIGESNLPLGTVSSGVYRDIGDAQGYHCPASKQDNKCGACRMCWNKAYKLVIYKEH